MPVETIAIVIGVTHYLQKDISSLPAAEMDAVNFARALRNWGIPEENILLLLNNEASSKSLEMLFDMLIKKQENLA